LFLRQWLERPIAARAGGRRAALRTARERPGPDSAWRPCTWYRPGRLRSGADWPPRKRSATNSAV